MSLLNSIPRIDPLVERGFRLMPAVVSEIDAARLRTELQAILGSATDGPISHADKTPVASRNIRQLWPSIVSWIADSPIATDVRGVLGPHCGLVRILYFDKPPGQSWSLPWHKDLTIAVREHPTRDPKRWKPTVKAGVPHVEAPGQVLRGMLTARLHLDDVTAENGPLLVVSGSHRESDTSPSARESDTIVTVYARTGDVLYMRPLLTHCSRATSPTTTRHRRILHLEFADSADLPNGLEWYSFDAL
jgi:hypothetical protein